MVELFRSVPESPEWLTIEQIKDYAERMGVLTDFFFVEVMAELKCLAEENPPDNANYWLEENRVNIFGYIEDNGNDDRWIYSQSCLQRSSNIYSKVFAISIFSFTCFRPRGQSIYPLRHLTFVKRFRLPTRHRK